MAQVKDNIALITERQTEQTEQVHSLQTEQTEQVHLQTVALSIMQREAGKMDDKLMELQKQIVDHRNDTNEGKYMLQISFFNI